MLLFENILDNSLGQDLSSDSSFKMMDKGCIIWLYLTTTLAHYTLINIKGKGFQILYHYFRIDEGTTR